jgi:hypothetical protein
LPVSRRSAFKALSKPARASSSIAAQQLQHAAVVQGRGFVELVQQLAGGVQAAAQDQVLGQRNAQRHRGAALGHVLLGVGAHRRGAGRLALDVVDQHRQHLVAHGAVDAFDEFRLEGAGADVDQRVQVGRLVAAQAGRQQRRDGLRAFAGQQGHAQQRHALAVAAQHGRALPVEAQRRH